jgi:CO/xanthine dehydrogenase Mo-binding subunit
MAIKKDHIDVWRALQEPNYAAQLSKQEWRSLFAMPDWSEVTGEFPELAEHFIKTHQDTLNRVGFGAHNRVRVQKNTSLAKQPEEFTVLGKTHEMMQHLGIFNGRAEYMVNKVMHGMLFMKTLRSPHPHALVKAIDTSQAEALPGVVAVLHLFNLPEEFPNSVIQGGPKPRKLFDEEVTQVGAPIVAVAAESEHIADEAIRLITVEYEVLPAVINYLEGMGSRAAKQWDNEYDGTILDIQEQIRGEPDSGLTGADVIVEGVSSRVTEQNAPLELSAGLFWWENERLNVQWLPRFPHAERDRIAQALNLHANQVRLIQPGYVGSSYGSHRNVDVSEIHAAILARITGRPVRAMMTRSEDFLMRTARAAEQTEGKLGVNRDGTFVAASFKTISDTGAGSGNQSTGAWIGFETLYNIPHLRLEGIGVFTNRIRAGTFRCVSHPYATLAQEILVDKAAYAIGMDPLEIRLKNINEVGHPDSERPYSNPGIRDCITQTTERIGWAQKWHEPKANEIRPGVFHGIGLAAHSCSHGAGSHPSTGSVIVHTDGTLSVVSAAADIGCGQRTLMRMIAAETLGIPYEQTSITLEVDTDVTSSTGGTFGSRMTNSGGWGVYQAAMDARRQILEGVAQKVNADRGITATLSEDDREEIMAAPSDSDSVEVDTSKISEDAVTADDFDIKDGVVFLKSDPAVTLEMAEAVNAVVPNTPVLGRGAHFHPPTWERLAFGAHAAEVEVDTNTGTVIILNYVAAHDVGRVLNPAACENQIQGGVVMGLNAAMMEGLLYDEATGLPITDNILEYKMMSIHDVPPNIDVIMVERPKEYGVYGSHGIGEPPIAIPPPTLANAIYNAIGVWVEDMPITRDKILRALGTA